MKIALVKQDVYSDLYVCSRDEKDVVKVLFSSAGRVGPIGLISDLNADFYIVKEEYDKETQTYRRVIPHFADRFQLLKTTTLDKIPGQEFRRPGSPFCNGDFSISCDSVDWGKYDVVISINISLPKRLIRKNPNTLFAYMIGEANIKSFWPGFGYDVSLNQLTRGIVSKRPGIVDFPYTFVASDSLEKIMRTALGRPSLKDGIYVEINSCQERPVCRVPSDFLGLQNAGHKIRLHKQLIRENLQEVYDAKYFLKLGGRLIRGNSVIEAISLGTLVLMNPSEVIHKELLPPETWIRDKNEAEKRIRMFEEGELDYQNVLEVQRALLDKFVYHAPLQSLLNCVEYKRRTVCHRGSRYD